MGEVWGTEIFSNDVACDIRDSYRMLLNYGYDGTEATSKLIKCYEEILFEPDYVPVFWLALAATQVKYGRLEEKTRNVAISIIDSGVAHKRWENHLTQNRKRHQVLAQLRHQLNSPPSKPQKLRKVRKNPLNCELEAYHLDTGKFAILRESKFGDAFSYRLDSGKFTILRVVGFITNPNGMSPIFELCDWTGTEIPAKNEIDQISYRPPIKGKLSIFMVGRLSKREYPIDRLGMIATGVHVYHYTELPCFVKLWREINYTLKVCFALE